MLKKLVNTENKISTKTLCSVLLQILTALPSHVSGEPLELGWGRLDYATAHFHLVRQRISPYLHTLRAVLGYLVYARVFLTILSIMYDTT